MNKRKFYIFIIAAGLSSILLSGCVTIGKAVSRENAIEEVTRVLGYEPKFTNSYVEKNDYKHNKKNYYYEFEDAKGMRFSYSSKLEPQGLDGATFYYTYENKINYKRRILPFYCETIEKLCDKYNSDCEQTIEYIPETTLTYDVFGNEEQFGSSYIMIGGYNDLEAASDLIAEILNECRTCSSESYLFNSDLVNVGLIVRTLTTDGKCTNVTTIGLISDDEDVNRDEIYNKIFKAYIETVKTGKIPNDVSEEVISGTCPEYMHGVYQDKYYDLWTAALVSDENLDAPEYSFKIEYREPKEREDYTYYEGYYSKGFRIYDIIAQLGGECSFHEKIKDRKCAGFEGSLGDDTYQFGFENSSMDTIYIVRNGKEYLFKTEISNPADNSYSFIIDKETFEEIFGVKITYNFAESTFTVERQWMTFLIFSKNLLIID